MTIQSFCFSKFLDFFFFNVWSASVKLVIILSHIDFIVNLARYNIITDINFHSNSFNSKLLSFYRDKQTWSFIFVKFSFSTQYMHAGEKTFLLCFLLPPNRLLECCVHIFVCRKKVVMRETFEDAVSWVPRRIFL